jgi:hypothetical protein
LRVDKSVRFPAIEIGEYSVFVFKHFRFTVFPA